MKIETNDYCNAKEAAKLYGCTQKRIYQLAKEQEIEAVKLWGFKVFKKDSVIEASKRIQPTKPRSGKVRAEPEENVSDIPKRHSQLVADFSTEFGKHFADIADVEGHIAELRRD